MAEVMPINFPLPSENAVASYNQEDIASGVGWVKFYCGVTDDGNYILTTIPFTSSVSSQYSILTTADASTITFESSAFNSPRMVGGKMLVKYPCTTGAVSGNRTWTIALYKNTTSLVSVSAITLPADRGGYYTAALTVPDTVIGIGDVIKVVFVQTAGSNLYLIHDPSDEFDGIIGGTDAGHSSLQCYIPFRIKL